MRNISRETRIYSLVLGSLLGLVYVCSTVGLVYTSMSNAAFLCALAVVFTPLVNFLVFKQKPSKRMGIVVVMALTGVALMTLSESLRPRLGDILCIGCAIFYAFDLTIAERAVKRPRVDALQMGVLHLGVAGVFNLILAFIIEQPTLPSDGKTWASVVFLAVFCPFGAYTKAADEIAIF